MLLTATIASLLLGAPCTLTGSIVLTTDEPDSEVSEVAVYVKYVDAKQAGKVVNRPHTILQQFVQFNPRVLVILKGDSVEFVNEDKDLHSVFSQNALPEFTFPPTAKGVTGTPPPFLEPRAFRVLCNIHKDMRADVLVVQNRFFTFAQADGSFSIEGLPAGDYTVVAWERNGSQVERRVAGCNGATRVTLPKLVAARKPTKSHAANGGMRPNYER